ncbi:MAG: hypothetical protein J1E05_03495 [Eubacterium sp.]|nr:hypothetical protein [Eubacterium sp.]
MKKAIIICSVIAVIAVAGVAVLTASGLILSGTKIPSVSKSATIAQVADFYADVVELTKNEKNMKIETVTTITFKDFDCPNETLSEIILEYLGYEVGDRETKMAVYSFENGVDSTGVTPLYVIQPAGAYIEKGNYAGLTLNSVEKDKEHTAVSFNIAEESADYTEIVEAFNSENSDFSALAPRHFDYIDVEGIVLYLKDMINVNFSSNDAENAIAEIESARISLGKTEIKADVNSKALLTEMTVTAPVVFDGTVRVINGNIGIAARLEVSQHYVFTYIEEK